MDSPEGATPEPRNRAFQKVRFLKMDSPEWATPEPRNRAKHVCIIYMAVSRTPPALSFLKYRTTVSQIRVFLPTRVDIDKKKLRSAILLFGT